MAVTAGSKVVIITSGARQAPGESRLGLTQRNVDMLKSMVPTIAGLSPNSIIIMITNPG